jgi:hypothetical protein
LYQPVNSNVRRLEGIAIEVLKETEMRLTFLLFVILLSSTCVTAQLPEWYRVYTFDESIIEMNTSQVTFGGKDIARVRLRWTFDQPEALSGEPHLKYKSRLEVMEFNCTERRYRLYDVSFYDAAGKVVRSEEMNPPDEWRTVGSGMVMESLFTPACKLIEKVVHPPMVSPAVSRDTTESERIAKYALSFSQNLERTKDFKPMIEKFFAANYLDGYLHDNDTNWFFNLDRNTAAKLGRAELQRFYVALLNANYLSSVYLISQYPSDPDSLVPDEKLLPPDVVQLIKDHAYTATYKRDAGNYDYLAEKVDRVERLRSYTDLLEKIAASMRKHVINVRAERSKEYASMLEDWDWRFALYQPKVRICAADCLGLPQGTRLFEVNVPVFHLQLAEINGKLKIISAIDYFQ